MTLTEILAELPKLKMEERDVIIRRIEELDHFPSPELSAAIGEADRSPLESDIPLEEMRQNVKARTCMSHQ